VDRESKKMKILIGITGKNITATTHALINKLKKHYRQVDIDVISAYINNKNNDCDRTMCSKVYDLMVGGNVDDLRYPFKCLEHIRHLKSSIEITNNLYDVCFFVNSDKITDFTNFNIQKVYPKQLHIFDYALHEHDKTHSVFVSISEYFWYCNSIDYNNIATFYKFYNLSSDNTLLDRVYNDDNVPDNEKMGYEFFMYTKILGITNVE